MTEPRQREMFKEPEVFFDGKTYDPALDKKRLSTLLGRVYVFMQDNQWHTLSEIQHACGGTEASVSARLRDLRKARFGGYTLSRKRFKSGLWAYQLKGME